jgi:hypothetical protein
LELTCGGDRRRPGNGGDLCVLEEGRVGGKAGADAAAFREQAERVTAAEAVARGDNFVYTQLLVDEVDGGIENGVGHLWAVLVQKVCEVEGRVDEVTWGRCAVEHVWGDRQVSSTTKAVRQSDGIQVRKLY